MNIIALVCPVKKKVWTLNFIWSYFVVTIKLLTHRLTQTSYMSSFAVTDSSDTKTAQSLPYANDLPLLHCFISFSRNIIKKLKDLFTVWREAARQSRCKCQRLAKCLVSQYHTWTHLLCFSHNNCCSILCLCFL